MGILKRVVDMTKAAANEVLDKMEKPSMMLNQYLRDLDEQIVGLEKGIGAQRVQERMLQGKLQDQNEQASFYEEKAEKAVAEGRETDARIALEAKLLYAEQANETAGLQQMTANSIAELEQNLELMKEERTRLQARRSELMTRINHTGKPHNESAAYSMHGGAASQGFDRIEQKIMEWEAHQAITRPASAYTSNQDAGYQQELRNSRVEEELQRLMQKQNGQD